MGCVTSKVMTRTGSFQEELNRSLKRRHGTLEDLLISSSRHARDRFLDFCNADEKQGNNNPETINTWDLMADLDDERSLVEEDGRELFTQRAAELRKRSQSFHLSDHESSNGIKEHASTNVVVRSKSFHTVDEYDAIMMERNGWPNTDSNWEARLEDFLSKDQTPYPLEDKNKNGVAESLALIAYNPDTGTKNVVMTCTNGNATNQDEKGVPRKTRAKHLTSLAIPSTIEFPVVASLKGWIHEGQLVHDVTPRFGSPFIFSTDQGEESVLVFDPEMVSSYEVAMEQLQVEEEFLLKHITED